MSGYKSGMKGADVVALLKNGLPIVDDVSKLDPNAELGSMASVAVQGNYVETSIRDLYQPDASMLDQNTGTLTQPELLSSVSSLKVFAPSDVNNIGFEHVESWFYLVTRDFSMAVETMARVEVIDGGVFGMTMVGGYDTMQKFVFVEYSSDTNSFIIHDDQVEAFNAILANGMDWCYFSDSENGSITEEQFNTIDLFIRVISGKLPSVKIYIKEDEWKPIIDANIDELLGKISAAESVLSEISENINYLNDNKANNITKTGYSSYNGISPNKYTIHSISSTGSVDIKLANIENYNIYNEYILELKCTSTPSSVVFKNMDETERTIVWANGVAPTFIEGMTYLISIANGFGVYSMFPNS